MFKIVLSFIAISNLALAEVSELKLDDAEFVLLAEKIAQRAAQGKKGYVLWRVDNVEAVIKNQSMINLVKNNLISNIKSYVKGDNIKFTSSIDIDLKLVGEKEKEKHVIIKIRGEDGDNDITYRYYKVGDNLYMQFAGHAILEILRTTE